MALSADATQGYEYVRPLQEDEIFMVAGNPGTDYTKGDLCIASAGVLTKATSNQAPTLIVMKTVSCPSAATAFKTMVDYSTYSSVHGDGDDLTVVPCRYIGSPAGTALMKCTFTDHWDDTVASYSSSTPYIEATTGMSTDDYPNGGLLYVYEGTGAGQMNIVADYDHTGGAAEKLLTLERKFQTDLSTDSKFIVLGGEATADGGIFPFGLCGIDDHNNITVDDHSDNGKMRFVASFSKDLANDLLNLKLPVVVA